MFTRVDDIRDADIGVDSARGASQAQRLSATFRVGKDGLERNQTSEKGLNHRETTGVDTNVGENAGGKSISSQCLMGKVRGDFDVSFTWLVRLSRYSNWIYHDYFRQEWKRKPVLDLFELRQVTSGGKKRRAPSIWEKDLCSERGGLYAHVVKVLSGLQCVLEETMTLAWAMATLISKQYLPMSVLESTLYMDILTRPMKSGSHLELMAAITRWSCDWMLNMCDIEQYIREMPGVAYRASKEAPETLDQALCLWVQKVYGCVFKKVTQPEPGSSGTHRRPFDKVKKPRELVDLLGESRFIMAIIDHYFPHKKAAMLKWFDRKPRSWKWTTPADDSQHIWQALHAMVAFEIRGEMCHVLPEPNPKDRRFPFYWCYSFNNTSNLRLLLVLLFCYVAKLDPWRKLDKARLNSGSTCPEEAVDPSTKFMITSLEETIRQRYEGALARLATAQLLAQTRSVKGTRRLRNPSRREITRSTTPTPGRESPVGTIALCGKEPQTAASGKSIPDMTVINMQSAEDRPGVPAERVPAKSESLVQKRLQVEKDDRQLAAMIDQESEHQAQISSSPSSPSHDNDSSEEQQQGGSTYRLTDHQQPPVSAREQLVKARSVLSGPTREARRKSIDRHPTEHEGIPPRPKTRLLEHSSEDGKAGYPGRPAAAHPARSIPAYQGNAAQQGHDARQRVTRRNTPLPPRGLQEWQGMDYVDAKLGQTAIAKVRQHAAEPMTGKDVAASFPSNGNTMHRPKLTAPLGKHQPVESSDTSQGETAHPPTCRKAAASLQSRHTQSKPGGHVIPQVPSSDVESEVSTLTDDTLSHRIPGSSSRHRSQRQRTDVEHRQPSHMQHAALPLWEHEPVVSRDPAPELSQTHQEMQEVRQRLHARDLAEQQEYAKLKSKVCDQLHLEWNNGRAPPASSGKPRALPPLEPRPRAAKPAHLRAPPVDVGVDNESELSSGPVAGEVSDQDTAKQQQPELLEQAPAPTSLNATTLERHEAYQRKQAQAQAALDPTAVEQEKQQQQDVQTRSFDEPAGKTIVKNGSIVRTVHYEPHTDTQMRKTITETDNASGNTLSMHVVLQELGDDAPHYHTTDYRYRGSEASYHGQRPVRDHSYMYSQTNGFGAHEPATTSSSASLRQASASRNPTRVQQLSSAMHTDPSTADSSSRLNKIATGSTLATAAAAREAARAADPPVMWLPKRQHHGFNMSGTRVKDCTEQMERVSEYFGKHGAETSQQPALQDMNDFQTMTGSTGQPISSSRSAYEERSSSYQTPQQQHANGRPFFSATSVGSRGRRYAGTGDQRSRPLKGGTGTVRNTGSKVGDASGKFVAPKQRTAGGSNVPLFSGVVAYTDPSNKSNRQLIRNSIKHVCLAGLTNQKRCTEVLETLEYSLCKHFLVLVREVPGCQFRALYEVDQGWKIRKLVGRGPLEVQVNMIDKLYKYNSGAKAFALIESRTLSASIDAFSLNAVFWKGKAPT